MRIVLKHSTIYIIKPNSKNLKWSRNLYLNSAVWDNLICVYDRCWYTSNNTDRCIKKIFKIFYDTVLMMNTGPLAQDQ